MNKVRVLLVEDHTLVRAGFRALLEKLEGIQVIGEVSNGRDALKMSKEMAPEVVLMDIAMPESEWARSHEPNATGMPRN